MILFLPSRNLHSLGREAECKQTLINKQLEVVPRAAVERGGNAWPPCSPLYLAQEGRSSARSSLGTFLEAPLGRATWKFW